MRACIIPADSHVQCERVRVHYIKKCDIVRVGVAGSAAVAAAEI